MGPLLWNRPAPADAETINSHVTDYRNYRAEEFEHNENEAQTAAEADGLDAEKGSPVESNKSQDEKTPAKQEPSTPQIEGSIILPRNLWIILRYKLPAVLLHGSNVDIFQKQMGEAGSKEEARMRSMLACAKQYPNETEHLFSFLQALTACTAVSPYTIIQKPKLWV